MATSVRYSWYFCIFPNFKFSPIWTIQKEKVFRVVFAFLAEKLT